MWRRIHAPPHIVVPPHLLIRSAFVPSAVGAGSSRVGGAVGGRGLQLLVSSEHLLLAAEQDREQGVCSITPVTCGV